MVELRPCDVARLVFGLGENSRLMKVVCGTKHDTKEMLLALLNDRLAWLCWSKTEDGQKGRNKPESIYDLFIGRKNKKTKRNETFDSIEDFEKARQEIIEGSKKICQI